ncbi:RNA polymerase sigma factor [Candidatus Sumerlaeota bacterium]|nr:RNA polymerase sigma factor [Candidatus Sumerlaeota bacterium]
MMVKQDLASNLKEEQTIRERFQKAIQGDPDAFWALIEPYSGLVYSVAFGIIKDPEIAQDVLHEVYVKSFHSLNNLRSPGRLSSWLHSMTRNLCYDFLRKQNMAEGKKADVYHHATKVVPIYDVLIQKEELQQLEQALSNLPEPFRVILGMKYMNRLSCREISSALDISVEATKSRLFEARRLLARKMNEVPKSKQSRLNNGGLK